MKLLAEIVSILIWLVVCRIWYVTGIRQGIDLTHQQHLKALQAGGCGRPIGQRISDSHWPLHWLEVLKSDVVQGGFLPTLNPFRKVTPVGFVCRCVHPDGVKVEVDSNG